MEVTVEVEDGVFVGVLAGAAVSVGEFVGV